LGQPVKSYSKARKDGVRARGSDLDLIRLVVLRPEGTDGLSGPPHLLVINLGRLLVEQFTVVLLSVESQGSSGLVTVLDGGVEGLEDGQVGVVELGGPVETATVSAMVISREEEMSKGLMTTYAPRLAVVEQALNM
jgi:hypothetical protein